MQTDRIIELTRKLDISDIDWEAGKQAGLNDDERFILTYFADIEAQTIMYMRDLLHTDAINDNDVLAFLGIWNYEEFFHGHALGKLLELCGEPLSNDRIAQNKRKSTFMDKFEALASSLVSRIFSRKFVALYLTWGAIQELTTHEGYRRIVETTENPVLKELCLRIMKQERVHFSWYFNNAKKRLEGSESTQRFVRFMLRHFWTPVGVGIKRPAEAARLFNELFPDEHGRQLAKTVDEKFAGLPGLQGISVMREYITKLPEAHALA